MSPHSSQVNRWNRPSIQSDRDLPLAGPELELAAGPEPELAAGPEPELAAGLEPELAAGPEPELAAGPELEPSRLSCTWPKRRVSLVSH
jgi:hypothetical protein